MSARDAAPDGAGAALEPRRPDGRARILAEATRQFVAGGYHRISMREIAEGVGITKAGIYYHFADKEALFLAILTAALERLEAAIEQARQAPTTRDRITRLVELIMAWEPEQRAVIRLAGTEVGHLSPEARAAFTRLYRASFLEPVEEILRLGVEGGELRALDPRVATRILLGMLYPFVHRASETESAVPADAVRSLLEIFFDGASARARGRPDRAPRPSGGRPARRGRSAR